MSSNSEISHRGRVLSVTPEVTTVEIVSESACSACHAKGFCSLGESKVKRIEVPTSGWSDFRPGDEVEVVLKATMGHKAVLLAYTLPLVILVAVLLAALSAGAGELQAGLAGLAAVAVYYFCLWLLRGRLRNEYIFNIKK